MKKYTIIPLTLISAICLSISTATFAKSHNGVVESTVKTTDNVIDDTVEGTGKIIKSTGKTIDAIGDSVTDSNK